MNLLKRLFSEGSFMPHGNCYLWNPGLLTLHIVSDTLIAAAYFSIPFTLFYFVRKRRDLEFQWMFVCFGVFIVACGMTHVMDIVVIWHPTYWLQGAVKVVTAVASVSTAILLIRITPDALALPGPAILRRANDSLEKEVAVRKESEAKSRRLNIELQRRAAQLEVANRELDAFSYSVSHDLRAPLRHISGYVELLNGRAHDSLDAKSLHYLETINASVGEMGRLIDALLDFSRIGRVEFTRARVELEPLVQAIIAESEASTRGRAVAWTVGPLPSVSGDAALLKSVFGNLISNAIKYTRPKPLATIDIGCSREDGEMVELFVRDNGVGFDMGHADKLFGVFQRLHHADEFEGTGIGLANARRIVSRLGGRIRAEGVAGVGATFTLTLPKAPNPT